MAMTQMRIAKQLVGLVLLAGAAASCGDVSRQGQSPVYLGINSLTAIRGGGAGSGTSFLLSDVITNVRSPAPCTAASPCPTIFNDTGVVQFRSSMKDVTSPLEPTTNNDVTLTRYRVSYRRADGRNTPGVDVPYPFEGAITVTVPGGKTATAGFEWVRHVAKQESPLVQLQNSQTTITTIGDVIFWGTDQVGNDITVTGSMQIDFGNFGDF